MFNEKNFAILKKLLWIANCFHHIRVRGNQLVIRSPNIIKISMVGPTGTSYEH